MKLFSKVCVVFTVMSLFLLVAGCSMLDSDNKRTYAATESIRFLAVQVDRAQKTGRISNEKEDELLDELLRANGLLRQAEALMDTCTAPCSSARSRMNSIDLILTEIERQLSRASP